MNFVVVIIIITMSLLLNQGPLVQSIGAIHAILMIEFCPSPLITVLPRRPHIMIGMRSVGSQQIWVSLPIPKVLHSSHTPLWGNRVLGSNPCISLAQPPAPHIALCTAYNNGLRWCLTLQSLHSVQHSVGLWLFCQARPEVTPKTQNNNLRTLRPLTYIKHFTSIEWLIGWSLPKDTLALTFSQHYHARQNWRWRKFHSFNIVFFLLLKIWECLTAILQLISGSFLSLLWWGGGDGVGVVA